MTNAFTGLAPGQHTEETGGQTKLDKTVRFINIASQAGSQPTSGQTEGRDDNQCGDAMQINYNCQAAEIMLQENANQLRRRKYATRSFQFNEFKLGGGIWESVGMVSIRNFNNKYM